MTHYSPHPQFSKQYEEQINPWHADETPNSNGLEFITFTPYHHLNRHFLSFNPEADPKSDKTNNKFKNKNFNSNLRNYQKKKINEIQQKKQTNFIQKNKKELIEQLPIKISLSKQHYHPHHSTPQKQKIQREQSEHADSTEMVNWSLIMYYDSEKNSKKHHHKDIQSFLRYHSAQTPKTSRKKQDNDFLLLQKGSMKADQDAFQKMLKLREGIRKRNHKSASSSKHNLDESLLAINYQDERLLRSTIHSENMSRQKKTCKAPLSISIASSSSKQSPPTTLQYRVEAIGNTNSIVVAKKQRFPDYRMIHSSHKNREPPKILNIEGQTSFA